MNSHIGRRAINCATTNELIQRTLNGETDAFGELIKRYQDAVYATALHRIGNFTDAQDVAQEAFIEAYKSLHKLREPDKFPGWLHRIALHQCNRWLRKQRESKPIEELNDAQILEISNRRTVLPDERFTEKVLAEIIEQTKAARKRDAHDEVMQLCEKALEVLEHLDMTEEHKRTQVDVLSWQSDEWIKWFGEPENALENFQRTERISAKLKDHEAQAKWLMMQAIALSRMEEYREMIDPVQKARMIYGELGETKSQIVCDALLDLVHLLPQGWERVDILPELRTGHNIHRYSLTCTQEAITYLDEEPGKWKAWCEVVVPYQMRRGYGTSRGEGLLASLGQQVQILLFPVEIGRSWQETLETQHGEKLSATRSIEAIGDKVVVPAGRFENCLRVKTATPEPTDADFSQEGKIYDRRKICGTRTMWFAPGVGLVKYRHDDDWGESLTVQLVEYQIEEDEQGNYLPISNGNRWKYERYVDWCRTRVTESYRVVATEAEIDLAQALIADPDGERAIKGGERMLLRAKVSDSEVIIRPGGGILPVACDKRPYPPIYDHAFWADAPLLKLPVGKGETWSDSHHDGLAERVIESVSETVSVPAGEFDNCVRVKTTMRLRAANEGSPQADEIYNRSKGYREFEHPLFDSKINAKKYKYTDAIRRHRYSISHR